MSRSRFVPVIVLLATVGCLYRAEVLSIDPSPRVPTAPDSIRVLAQEPAQSYKVVAMISVYTGYGWGAGTLPRLSRALSERAAKLGGHGVLLGPESVSGGGLTGRVIVFDSVLPPLQPTARASYTGPIIALSTIAFVGLVVPGIVVLVSN